jgi:hypothetical protein
MVAKQANALDAGYDEFLAEQHKITSRLVKQMAARNKGTRGRAVEGADGKKYTIEDEIPGQGGKT